MQKKLISKPAIEPITLDEAKTHCRVYGNDDDAYLTALIVAAREIAESSTGLALITQTWGIYLDGFPCSSIRFPIAPLLTVESADYVDADGAEQTLDPSAYVVDDKSRLGRIVAVDSWPTTADVPNAVTITITAGYGQTADTVPMPIRQAMLLLIGEMYENREESVIGVSAAQLPLTAERLLHRYRVYP